MWDFVNTNFFVALSTIAVGTFAFILYFKQKKDKKQEAAIIIVNEIRNVEEAIDQIKDSLKTSDSIPEVSVLAENNWNKYSNLFSKVLDQDEIKLINKFYSKAERVNYIVRQSNDMFILQVVNRVSALQHANVNLIAQSTEENVQSNVANFEKRLWDMKVSATPYTPNGFRDNLTKYLNDMQPILSTTLGAKLKKIANV